MAINDTLLDRGIRHAIHLERAKKKHVDKVLRLLNRQVIPDIARQLQRMSPGERGFAKSVHKTERLRGMMSSVKGIIHGGYRHAGQVVQKDMSDLALSEAEFQAAMLNKTFPIAIDFATPSPALLDSIVTQRPFQGRFLSQWFGDLAGATQRRLTRELNIGLVQGETIDAIMRRFRSTMKISRRQATSIVRTAANHVTTQAREMTYAANSDVIKAVQWVSTLDSRTSDICISLDGTTYPINEGARPPAHHQCRSTTVPVTKSWQELGIPLKDIPPSTRASVNGQVASTVTYPQWLKRQSKGVQNEVLGKGRAELFRQGKFSLSKPISTGGLPSLRQLRQSAKRAAG